MELIKVAARDLKPGMFVSELDRPWLETPFLLQGFVIRDSSDVDFVSRIVDYVYVDAEYSGAPRYLEHASTSPEPGYRGRLDIRQEFESAKVNFSTATQALDKVFEAIREGASADVGAVKEAVDPLIEGVFRNHEAVAALIRLRERGHYHYQHGVSMAVWAAVLGRHIGLPREQLERLAVGCAMCDVGMSQLPAELLNQPDKLTTQQARIINAHPTIGSELVSQSSEVDLDILGIVENHHERMDGSGYPRGAEGTKIPILARIAGIVDTYDAMITTRPYAVARTSHEAAQELIEAKATKFQDELVEQFIQAIGLFPTGTIVELNTGEVAIVIKQNHTRRLKPEVLVVLDAKKQKMDPMAIANLINENIGAKDERWINREVLPGTYGIDAEEYFI